MYMVDFNRVMVGRQGALPGDPSFVLRDAAQVIKTTPAPARLVFFCLLLGFLLLLEFP